VIINTVLYLEQIHAWKSCELFAVYSSGQRRNALWPLFNAVEVATGLATKHTKRDGQSRRKASLVTDPFYENGSRTHSQRISILQMKSVCLSEVSDLTAQLDTTNHNTKLHRNENLTF
jgi:hypothetical protein